MKFKGILFSVKKNQGGDIKLVLEVSKTEAQEVLNIPEEVVLDVEITPEAN